MANAVELPGAGDLQRLNAAQDIQFGEKQFGEPADLGGVAQDDRVHPATAPAAPGRGAEFIPKVFAAAPQALTERAIQLGQQGAGADPGRKALGHADDAVHVQGAKAQTDQRAAGDRRGAGHEGVVAVVQIKHGALRALANDARALPQAAVDVLRRILNVRGQAHRRVDPLQRRGPGVQRAVSGPEQRFVGPFNGVMHGIGKSFRVLHQAGANPATAGLVQIGGADAAQGGPDRPLTQRAFAGAVQGDVRRRDDVRPRTDEEAFRRQVHAARPKLVHLGEQVDGIDDHAVAKHAAGALVENAGRDQMQFENFIAHGDGVTGIVAPGVTGHHVRPGAKHVGDATLAFIAPLGADD